jgi:hypothetical protein
MFASQLGAAAASVVSTIQYSTVYDYGIDANRDNVVQPNEILYNLGPISYTGFDINNPSLLQTFNQIGSYKTPRTHEIVVGLDHELMANLGVSASFTWRRYNDLIWNPYPLVGVTSADYTQSNILNRATTLGLQYDMRRTGLTGFGRTPEIMNPRIFRLGARFTF